MFFKLKEKKDNDLSFKQKTFTSFHISAAAAESLQSCPTLSDPMDYSLPGSSIHGIFQARVLEWGAIHISNNIHMRLFLLSCSVVSDSLVTL